MLTLFLILINLRKTTSSVKSLLMNTKQKFLNSSNKSLKFQGAQRQGQIQQILQEDQTLVTEGSKEVTSQT